MNITLTAEAIHLNRDFFSFPAVKAIEKEFGFKGSKLILDILFEVTETGFETAYNRPLRDKIAKRNSVSERLVAMIVQRLINHGFLEKKRYNADHVLAIPSKHLLDSYPDEGVHLPYFFIKPSLDRVITKETQVNSEETRINPEETINHHHLHLNNTAYGASKEKRS